jgi:hypothetical protein
MQRFVEVGLFTKSSNFDLRSCFNTYLSNVRGKKRGSIIGLLQIAATPEKGNIHFDGGVALGVSGLFIQTHSPTPSGQMAGGVRPGADNHIYPRIFLHCFSAKMWHFSVINRHFCHTIRQLPAAINTSQISRIDSLLPLIGGKTRPFLSSNLCHPARQFPVGSLFMGL